MGTETKKQVNNEVTANVPHGTNDKKSDRPITYVVTRDGYRVSDREYLTSNDPIAIGEVKFWTTVSKKHSYGEPVEVVKYDVKRHRVW